MNGKQTLFMVLLFILGGSLLYRFYWADSASGVIPFRAATESRRPAVNLSEYTVRTDLLTASGEAQVGEVVNIFAPVARPAGAGRSGKGAGKETASSEAQVVAPRPAETVQAPPPPPPKTPEQLAAERAIQDLERFRYLGFVRKGETRSFFLGKGDELLVVKEGELVKGLYNIKLMGKDYLILADPGTGMEKRLDLAGK